MPRLRQKKIPLLAPVLMLLFLALLPRPGSGTHSGVDYIENDASCSDLAPTGIVWHEMKVSSVSDGSHSKGTLTVTLDVESSNDGALIAWSSNLGIDGVFLKGGPGGNFYHYPSQATSDSGLVTPINPNSGNHYPPNYMLFCTTNSLTPPTPTPPPTIPATATPIPSATVPSPTATSTAMATSTATGTATTSPTSTATPALPTGTLTVTPTVITATASASPTATSTPDFPSTPVYASFICSGCSSSAGEPNDSCKVARAVQPDLSYDFYPDDHHDWYWFRLEQPAEVEIRVENFVPLAGQLAAYYGDNCEDATFLKNYGMSEPEKILVLGQQPPGLYYIYVSNDGVFNSDDAYQLFIDVH